MRAKKEVKTPLDKFKGAAKELGCDQYEKQFQAKLKGIVKSKERPTDKLKKADN